MTAAFEKIISLNLAPFTPEAAKQKHIEIARAGLAAFLARQSVKPGVQIFVDGSPATSENAVKPFGVIQYRMLRFQEACLWAKAQAVALSPVGKGPRDKHPGLYKQSWFFLVDGHETPDDQISEHAREVILTNDQPYARKIHVGSKGFEAYVPPGIIEKVRQMLFRRYGKLIDVEIEFITLAGGYVIRGNQRTALAQLNRKSSVFRAGGTHLARRTEQMRGAAMSYPALVMKPERFV